MALKYLVDNGDLFPVWSKYSQPLDRYMRDEYSTLDIVKALKIPRGRLREWYEFGYIKPTVSADGQGTKAKFSRDDVYAVALFRHLVDLGFDRKMAAVFVKGFVEQEKGGQEKHKTKYIVFKSGNIEGERFMTTHFHVDGTITLKLDTVEPKVLGLYRKITGTQGISSAWDTAIIINFQSIAREVDRALGEI